MATINGTDGPDDLSSSTAGDLILGLGGDDTLSATAANITLDGGSGDDQLFSSGGATLIGGSGADLMISTGTNDTASYANEPTGVTVDLLNGFAIDGTGGTDTLLGIANVTGSASADSLTGDNLANVLQGGAGNDTLTGNGGADVFKYSFTATPGQGTSSTFTDWLSAKYGKDFGDQLPDYVPTRHDKDDKHRKDDKHNSKDDDHGKNDQHDKQGKDDGHNSENGDHDGRGGDAGQHAPNGGLTEKFFETNYKEWLNEVVVADLLEQGYVLDANGNGKIKIDLHDDSQNGTPRIEGLTKVQLAEMFGDRDSVILNDDGKTDKAWYSNSFTSGNGQGGTASGDGLDTILDFTAGEDTLNFSGITQQQLLSSFNGADTVLTIDGVAGWSLTLVGVSAFDSSADAVFS